LKKTYLLLIIIFCWQSIVFAKIKNNGIPFIKNYYKNEYKGGTQNWDVVQTPNGLMYFANNDGVLEFDGNNWRLIQMPNKSIVRSLAIDSLNRIFVGAYNDFGFLKPDKSGKLSYHSLVNLLPDSERDFREVWNIYPFKKGMLIHSFGSVFYYKNGKISQIKAKNEFHFSFMVNDQFFVREKGIGLCKLDGRSIQLIKEGSFFKDLEIVGMTPFSDGAILIATALDGLFLYKENRIETWDISLNSDFKTKQIFCMARLNGEYLAVGTVRDGLYVFNTKGEFVQKVNTKTGLQNNTILSLHLDRDENLWLGLDNGIDLLEISSPLSTFPRNNEIGSGYASIYHKGHLYLGTNMGLFVKKHDFSNRSRNEFELVKNTSGQVWSLQVIGDELICGHNKGTFRIEKNRGELLSDVEGGWTYLYKEEFPDILIGGTYSGLILLKKSEGNWKFVKRIDGFLESSKELLWDKDNSIWMCHGYKGVYRIYLNEDFTKCTHSRFYGTNDGLPSNLNINIHKIRNEKVFSTDSGFYKYIPEVDRFEKHQYLNNLFGKNESVNKLIEESNGDVWFFEGNKAGILKSQLDNSYEIHKKTFSSIQGKFINAFENVSVIDSENVLIGTERGFVHYDPSIVSRFDKSYSTFIRNVYLTNAGDSIIYHGNYSSTLRPNVKAESKVSLAYKNNALRFEYSAPIYNSSEFVQYKYQLIGFEPNSSVWTKKLQKEYTNLPEGDYVFKVLSENQYGLNSRADEFQFTILPPWYRSYLAYFFYAVLFVFSLYGIVYLIRRRVKRMQYLMEKKQKEEIKIKEQKFREEALIAEREIVQLRNEKLRGEVDFKNKELASSTMNIIHKNEVLSYSVGELKKALRKIKDPTALVQVRQLMKTIDSEFNSEHDWEQFEIHFDKVHENFIKRLRNDYPQLTPKDLRLCAYLRMNLSTKEIAPLMNISVRGVEISRYRLRKKFDLTREENLIDFILNV